MSTDGNVLEFVDYASLLTTANNDLLYSITEDT